MFDNMLIGIERTRPTSRVNIQLLVSIVSSNQTKNSTLKRVEQPNGSHQLRGG